MTTGFPGTILRWANRRNQTGESKGDGAGEDEEEDGDENEGEGSTKLANAGMTNENQEQQIQDTHCQMVTMAAKDLEEAAVIEPSSGATEHAGARATGDDPR